MAHDLDDLLARVERLERERDALHEQQGRLIAALRERRFNYHRLAAALREVPMSGASRLDAIYALCEVLKADNPRFQPGLFMEMCLEDV